VVDEVFDVALVDVERAKTVVLGSPRLSARDALHVAIMEREGIRRILTFDRGFDGVPGISRVTA
jgi:predicted nucleic acid-binding protein